MIAATTQMNWLQNAPLRRPVRRMSLGAKTVAAFRFTGIAIKRRTAPTEVMKIPPYVMCSSAQITNLSASQATVSPSPGSVTGKETAQMVLMRNPVMRPADLMNLLVQMENVFSNCGFVTWTMTVGIVLMRRNVLQKNAQKMIFNVLTNHVSLKNGAVMATLIAMIILMKRIAQTI